MGKEGKSRTENPTQWYFALNYLNMSISFHFAIYYNLNTFFITYFVLLNYWKKVNKDRGAGSITIFTSFSKVRIHVASLTQPLYFSFRLPDLISTVLILKKNWKKMSLTMYQSMCQLKSELFSLSKRSKFFVKVHQLVRSLSMGSP